jgi:Domain of unknown function (DUF1883)
MEAKGHQVVTSGPAAFEVDLNSQADVYAMDPANWSNARSHRAFSYVDGGRAVRRPAVVRVPHAGTWWIVVAPDPGTSVRYSISEVA